MRVCPSCFAQESDDAQFCGLCGAQLFEVVPSSTSLVGLVLADKYVIQRLIARGGMGEVYLGEHKGIGQKVAVKILSRHFKGDETVVRRFVNEARSYGRVTHPNAVKIYDLSQLDDGTLYLVMEYIDGETLTQHVERRGGLDNEHVIHLAIQLSDVLLAAHAQGVVHRDLKPDNIMLIESKPRTLLDKGLGFWDSQDAR